MLESKSLCLGIIHASRTKPATASIHRERIARLKTNRPNVMPITYNIPHDILKEIRLLPSNLNQNAVQ